jgi:hypothetical protein
MPTAEDRSARPRLSVVIVAWTGTNGLRACLESLASQLDTGHDEVVVARNFTCIGDAPLQVGDTRITDIEHVGETVPELRATGLAVASGELIAFIEDHCRCGPGWRSAVVGGHLNAVAGVGGPVDLAGGGHPIDWAVYFYDYARFMPPMASGVTRSLSGANMSWKRGFLAELAPQLGEGVLEPVLEQECSRSGSGMYLAGDAIVTHSRETQPWPAVRLAFALARGYASKRVAGNGMPLRVARMAMAVALPVLFLARIVAAALRSGRHISKLVMALPWLVVLLVVWSAGEGVGYVAGEGDSRRQWR